MDLTDLKKMTYDFKCPMDEVLIAYRKVAKKANSNLLLDWITKELNGYSKDEIPPYRFVKNDTLKSIYVPKKPKTMNGIIKKRTELHEVVLIDKEGNKVVEILKEYSSIGLECGIAELQSKTDKNNFYKNGLLLYIDYTVEYESNKSKLGYELIDKIIATEIDADKLTTVVNNIRIILQDFIDELEKIENWENNPLTSILIDNTFTFNININVNNTTITNRIDSGDGNIINNGNNNNINTSDDDVIERCLDLLENIKTSDTDLDILKSSIRNTLNEFTRNNVSNKTKILEKISAIILTSTAVLADVATAMPLFAPLLNYLKG